LSAPDRLAHQTLCFNGDTGDIVDLNPSTLTLHIEDAQ
jgi:hypothetical protein